MQSSEIISGNDCPVVLRGNTPCHLPIPVNVRISSPSFSSQTRRVWSAEPETTWRPSGVTTTSVTQLVWPWSVVLVCPVASSQTRRVWPAEPETTWRPSGVTTTARGVALERRFGLPRREVPNAQGVVRGAGDHVAAIRCNYHGSDPACMALERRFGLPRRQVPNAQRVVPGAGDHLATIGGDCQDSNRARYGPGASF